MKKELEEKAVLAMYDVRGIQNYIFETNQIKEIVGASALVENIMIDGIKAVIEAHSEWEKIRFLTDWEEGFPKGHNFWENPEVRMQVLFIGGGNAFVLFRSGNLCKEMNRALAKYVLTHTYSLQLAVAVVAYTGNYKNDYNAINQEMRAVKARMPEGKPLGALPFMAADPVTGYPLTHEVRQEEKMYLCTEANHKRMKYSENNQLAAEKILDYMVTEKGNSSDLAVVHIDGNNMGKRIQEIMRDKEDYPEAVRAMRSISVNIRDAFKEAFNVMTRYIDSKLADRIKPDRKGKLYRKLILAGDDVTFICNAMVALEATAIFLRHVTTRWLYEDSGASGTENQKKYGFSACGGIAFFYSHFPFSDAYQVAEACCASAKERAKALENRDSSGNIGNFFDYQICTHINAVDLKVYREKQYTVSGTKNTILYRPYYVSSPVLESISDLNERNRKYDYDEILRKNINAFKFGMPRGQAKKLRNYYGMGRREVDKYVTFLKSRNAALPESAPETWYDALEIMDLFPGKEEKENAGKNTVAE